MLFYTVCVRSRALPYLPTAALMKNSNCWNPMSSTLRCTKLRSTGTKEAVGTQEQAVSTRNVGKDGLSHT